MRMRIGEWMMVVGWIVALMGVRSAFDGGPLAVWGTLAGLGCCAAGFAVRHSWRADRGDGEDVDVAVRGEADDGVFALEYSLPVDGDGAQGEREVKRLVMPGRAPVGGDAAVGPAGESVDSRWAAQKLAEIERRLGAIEEAGVEVTAAPRAKAGTAGKGALPAKAKGAGKGRGKGRTSSSKMEEMVERVKAYFGEHPDATWGDAFVEVPNTYKTWNSMQASLSDRIDKPGRRKKRTKWRDQYHKRTLAEAQAEFEKEHGGAA